MADDVRFPHIPEASPDLDHDFRRLLDEVRLSFLPEKPEASSSVDRREDENIDKGLEFPGGAPPVAETADGAMVGSLMTVNTGQGNNRTPPGEKEFVIPAKAGIPESTRGIPAFAGMTSASKAQVLARLRKKREPELEAEDSADERGSRSMYSSSSLRGARNLLRSRG